MYGVMKVRANIMIGVEDPNFSEQHDLTPAPEILSEGFLVPDTKQAYFVGYTVILRVLDHNHGP